MVYHETRVKERGRVGQCMRVCGHVWVCVGSVAAGKLGAGKLGCTRWVRFSGYEPASPPRVLVDRTMPRQPWPPLLT